MIRSAPARPSGAKIAVAPLLDDDRERLAETEFTVVKGRKICAEHGIARGCDLGFGLVPQDNELGDPVARCREVKGQHKRIR
jgi:hypothetical protein